MAQGPTIIYEYRKMQITKLTTGSETWLIIAHESTHSDDGDNGDTGTQAKHPKLSRAQIVYSCVGPHRTHKAVLSETSWR